MAQNCAICGKAFGFIEKKYEFYNMKICSTCGKQIPNIDGESESSLANAMRYYTSIAKSNCNDPMARSYACIRALDFSRVLSCYNYLPKDKSCALFVINMTERTKYDSDLSFGITFSGYKTERQSSFNLSFPGICPITLNPTREKKNLIIYHQTRSGKSGRNTASQEMLFEIPCCAPIESLTNYLSIWITGENQMSVFIRNREYAEVFQKLNGLNSPTSGSDTRTGGKTFCNINLFLVMNVIVYGDQIYNIDNETIMSAISNLECTDNNASLSTEPPKSDNAKIFNTDTEIDALQKYKRLFDEGVISEEEFVAKKKQILGI